eukprot:IDg18126t1
MATFSSNLFGSSAYVSVYAIPLQPRVRSPIRTPAAAGDRRDSSSRIRSAAASVTVIAAARGRRATLVDSRRTARAAWEAERICSKRCTKTRFFAIFDAVLSVD